MHLKATTFINVDDVLGVDWLMLENTICQGKWKSKNKTPVLSTCV